MKTKLVFKTEQEYLQWEAKQENTIYALEDIKGNYIGDIRQQDLVPFWNSCMIVSFDNPQSEDREEIVSMFKQSKCNWGVLPRHVETVKDKLVEIEILHTDKVDKPIEKGLYYVKELECLMLVWYNKRGAVKFTACNFFHDLFTSIIAYSCGEGQLLSKVSLVRITPLNYKQYLTIDNLVGSARGKQKNEHSSCSYAFSTEYGMKIITKDEDLIVPYRKEYPYLEDKNFNKEVLIVTIVKG